MDRDTRDTFGRDMLSRELQGNGVEFGPGCHPLKLGMFVKSIRYCDAHDRAAFAKLFPEAGESVRDFPDPIDFRLQFDREPFVDVIGRCSLDFVVANHLLEHLLDPIGFLDQCYQLLAPGGMLFLGLPDKRWIFDRNRRRTTLADLIARHESGEKDASDERIAEFVNQVERPNEPISADDPGVRDYLDAHRRRSVHLNVWILDDIVELLQYLGRERKMPWALYDGALGSGEILLLMRKTERVQVLDHYGTTLARLHYDATRRQLDALEVRLGGTARVNDSTAPDNGFVRSLKRVAKSVPGSDSLKRWIRRAG